MKDSNDDFEISPDLVIKYKEKFRLLNDRKISIYSSEATDWFRKRVIKDSSINPNRILNFNNYIKKIGNEGKSLIGKMYFYRYKAEMPGDLELNVYDQYPLVFFFNSIKSSDGNLLLYGLNLHYLPPKLRMILFEQLLILKSSKKYTKSTKLQMTWEIIKGVATSRLYERCVHCYRVDRIQSELAEIPSYDWNIVVFLQLANFVNLSTKKLSQSYIKKQISKRK